MTGWRWRLHACFVLVSVTMCVLAGSHTDFAAAEKSLRRASREAHVTQARAAVEANVREGVLSETLLRTSTSWNDVPYRAYPTGAPELSVLRITIPAHGTLPWHAHLVPNAAHVLSGAITVRDRDGKTRHFSAGQVIPETVDAWHTGVVGDESAVFIVFYAGAKGLALSKQEGAAVRLPDAGHPPGR